jgi:Tol biopolymer transport system component
MPSHARRMLAAASITLMILAATAGSALATLPGHNGQITFQRVDASGYWQVWVANPDLTHERQITAGAFGSGFPSWSPDDSRIVFQSDRADPDVTDGYEIQDVFTMRRDGTDVRKITDSLGFSGTPSWSPDGRWIVFNADRADYPGSQGIYIVRSDGSSRPRRITSLPAGSGWQELARFSPDGKRIVFDEVRNAPQKHPDDPVIEVGALFTVRLDGSDLRRVTPWGLHAVDADWSPDGRRLVFASQPAEDDYIQRVMVVDADGRHLRELTHGDGITGEGDDTVYQESFNPAWSPDGTKIIFVRASYTAADGFAMGLMTMRPDGSRQAWVSDDRGEEHQPDWGSAPLIR